MASISHTSITGRKKSFERTRLIKRHVGTANSNEAADASRFLVFNRLNSAKTLQRKTTERAAVGAPAARILPLLLSRRLSTYKKGE